MREGLFYTIINLVVWVGYFMVMGYNYYGLGLLVITLAALASVVMLIIQYKKR